MRLKLFFLTFFTFITAMFVSGQSTGFAVTATKINDEFCPNNGAISWTTTGIAAGALVTYNIVDAATNQVVISTNSNVYSGLKAGSYKVVATQVLENNSSQTTSNTVTINNTIVPLAYTMYHNSEICGADGSVIINVSQGRPGYTYQLYDAANTMVAQYVSTNTTKTDSYTFKGLTAGTYRVVVIDQCGQGVAKNITVTKTPSNFTVNNPGVYNPITLSADCSTLSFYLNVRVISGNSLKLPATSVITYVNPNTGATEQVTTTHTSFNGGACGNTYCDNNIDGKISIPFFASSNSLPIHIEVTDACGTKAVLNYTINQQLNINPSLSAASCGGSYLNFNSGSGINASKYKITFNSAPAGFDPVVYNSNHDTFQANHTYGSATQPLPVGTYNLTITDSCGRTRTASVTVTSTAPSLNNGLYMGCPINKANVPVTVSSGYKMVSARILSAPAAFGQTLPFDVPASWFTKTNAADTQYNGFLMSEAPAGSYTVEYVTSCSSQVYTGTFTVQSYSDGSTASVVESCSSATINYNMNFNPYSYNNKAIIVQRYWPQYGEWSYINSYTAPPAKGYRPGSQIASGYNNYSGTINLTNLPAGKYRIISDYLYPTIAADGTVQSEYDCPRVINQFEIGDAPVIDNAYAFLCEDNTYDVAVSATGGLAPLTYSLVSDGTASATTLQNNGTNPIFHGLTGGIYYFRVTDACGNFVTRKLEVARLGKPGIKFTPDCTKNTLKLSVEGLDYLSYQWYKSTDPSTILSTSHILDLGTFTADKAGTYKVRMYTTNPTYCLDHTEQISVTPNAFSAGSAGTGQKVTIDYNGTDKLLDLFAYLTPPYDGYGQWTEVSGPQTNLLEGHYWNIGYASGGTYVFRYTVISPCTGTVSTADVTIILNKVCYNPVVNTAAGLPVKHGITLLKRAGKDNGNWPMNRNSAHTALESNTKGFVITRVPTSGLSAIANPVEGMMVYDTTEKCIKIYVVDNTTPEKSGWKCFSTPACPN